MRTEKSAFGGWKYNAEAISNVLKDSQNLYWFHTHQEMCKLLDILDFYLASMFLLKGSLTRAEGYKN